MLADKVKKYIQAQQLVKPGDRVIIGVSGGPDSVALLHIMHILAPQLNCELIAAHLNHELRAEAAAEEAFVKQLCRNMGIKCYSRTVPVAKIAREQKAGVEAIGRRVRYDFFSELLQELGAQRIATAHHQDDVAETVLMNLLRGSGIKGLRGILPVRGVTIRPLLNVSKQELLEYLDSYSITYCTDESNADQYYMRNRIRHSLIPFLEQEFNPRIVDKLNQLAMIAQEEYSALEQESRRLWAELLLREDEGIVVLDNRILLRLPRAYQRRIVLQAFTALAGAAEWGMDDVEKVLGLSSQVNSGSALTLHLKKKVLVNKSYDKMIFTTRVIEKTEFSYRLSIPGRVDITEIGCSYFITRVGIEDFTPAEGDVYFDYDLLPDNLYLRSRRPGDYYRPPGMQGRKKLKKMFIDLKIPYAKRDQVVLLAGEESEIYAVLGLGISRKAALNPQTKVVLLIRSQRG